MLAPGPLASLLKQAQVFGGLGDLVKNRLYQGQVFFTPGLWSLRLRIV